MQKLPLLNIYKNVYALTPPPPPPALSLPRVSNEYAPAETSPLPPPCVRTLIDEPYGISSMQMIWPGHLIQAILNRISYRFSFCVCLYFIVGDVILVVIHKVRTHGGEGGGVWTNAYANVLVNGWRQKTVGRRGQKSWKFCVRTLWMALYCLYITLVMRLKHFAWNVLTHTHVRTPILKGT